MGKRRKQLIKRPAAKTKKINFTQRGLPRDLLVIFLISFFISTALIVYLFGMPSDFFSRLFWCILVIFLLITVTVFGIIPLINYVGSKWLRR
jgi:antibiotic biosynthesis monooxygenase (ABM) superfamily enzyme